MARTWSTSSISRPRQVTSGWMTLLPTQRRWNGRAVFWLTHDSVQPDANDRTNWWAVVVGIIFCPALIWSAVKLSYIGPKRGPDAEVVFLRPNRD